MTNPKIRIIVDVLWDEAGNNYYQLLEEGRPSKDSAPLGLSDGVFLQESDLDEWLEEHASVVKVVKDYRGIVGD
jgi:hypothetical protein